MKEEVFDWTKVVGYVVPSLDPVVTCRVGVVGGLLLSVVQLILFLWHLGNGIRFVEASLYLGESSAEMIEREKERVCLLISFCFGSARKNVWSTVGTIDSLSLFSLYLKDYP